MSHEGPTSVVSMWVKPPLACSGFCKKWGQRFEGGLYNGLLFYFERNFTYWIPLDVLDRLLKSSLDHILWKQGFFTVWTVNICAIGFYLAPTYRRKLGILLTGETEVLPVAGGVLWPDTAGPVCPLPESCKHVHWCYPPSPHTPAQHG